MPGYVVERSLDSVTEPAVTHSVLLPAGPSSEYLPPAPTVSPGGSGSRTSRATAVSQFADGVPAREYWRDSTIRCVESGTSIPRSKKGARLDGNSATPSP